jgi:NAD(P)-dependent dehydrogenase (short-subunit alcohol dehydrogenase family)
MVGGYCLTKAALESMADALRQELRGFGIGVSILQPGAVETPLWEKGGSEFESFAARSPSEMKALYGETISRVVAMTADYRRRAVPPRKVTPAVVHAFTARRAKARYLVGGNARPQQLLSRLPSRWRDFVLRAVLGRFG